MEKVEARTVSLEELLAKQTYTLGYFQREYNWERRHVADLVDDLVNEFQSQKNDSNSKIDNGHVYFLGSIIVCGNDRQNLSLIDGQQRITTLLLILIHIVRNYQNIENYDSLKNSILPLIYSKGEGKNRYTIDEPNRDSIMNSLCEIGDTPNVDGKSKSIMNIKERFQDIDQSLSTKKLTSSEIFEFVSWLKNHVYIAEIKTLKEQDGYKIFEGANDRGLKLTSTDMLKGYLLSNIESDKEKSRLDSLWRKSIDNILDQKESDSEAIKAWLRARHAASHDDFIRIGGEFHRWVRDKVKNQSIPLQNSQDFVNFIENDFEFYTKLYVKLNQSAKEYTASQEAIYCNHFSNFTMQYPIILSFITPNDDNKTISKKIKAAAAFIDILIARILWNGKSIAQRDMKHKIWEITREIRSKKLNEGIAYFLNEINNLQDSHFSSYPKIKNPRLFLARFSAWLDRECKDHDNTLLDYLKKGGDDGYDIEHIIPRDYGYYSNGEFEDEEEFKQQRESFGALLLLKQSINRSLAGKPYEKKITVYRASGHLLVKTLNISKCSKNNKQLKDTMEKYNIVFADHEHFLKNDIIVRQQAYTRMAQAIWDIDRIKQAAED